MKRNAQYRTAVLPSILVGILITIAVRNARAQSYVFDTGGWTKTVLQLVQEQNNGAGIGKLVVVATVAGDDEDTLNEVGKALAAASMGGLMTGDTMAEDFYVLEKDLDRAISILDADANKNHYTVYITRPKEEKQRDDGYAMVASIKGKPAIANTVFRTLDAANIPAKMFGSRTYDVYVPEKEFDRALKLLGTDSKRQHYGIDLNREHEDKYVTVASVHGDSSALDKVSKALHTTNIPAVVQCSSRSFLVRVSPENHARALRIIAADAKKQHYGLLLY